MQKTTNYQLPKWEKTDRILMDDFNGMTAALDTALHGVAVSAEAAQAAVDSEAADRQAADAAEATARANAVTAERASCSAALSAETTARINAVAAEATERANADAALQSAINGKAASSHTHAQSAITGLTAALAAKGNCSVLFGSYVGNGTFGPNTPTSLSLSARPKFIVIMGDYGAVAVPGTAEQYSCIAKHYSGQLFTNFTWSGNTLSWSSSINAAEQFNSAGVVYPYAAFYA